MKHKHSKTRLYDKGREELIKLDNLRIGDMLVFSMTGRKPKISVLIMDFGKNVEDTTHENSSDSNSDENSESEEENSYIVPKEFISRTMKSTASLRFYPKERNMLGFLLSLV